MNDLKIAFKITKFLCIQIIFFGLVLLVFNNLNVENISQAITMLLFCTIGLIIGVYLIIKILKILNLLLKNDEDIMEKILEII